MRRLSREPGNWCGLIIVPAIVLTFAVNTSAQKKAVPPAKSGVVSGRVFAVTKSGDLKPARGAQVVLLYMYRSEKAANENPKELDSAGMAWLDNQNKALGEFNRQLTTEGAGWSDARMCRQHLLAYAQALSATIDWASENNKPWQILSTDADEDGAFKIAVPRPGKYEVVATGRAGFNDAVWETDFKTEIHVEPGMTTEIKLSSPKEACLN